MDGFVENDTAFAFQGENATENGPPPGAYRVIVTQLGSIHRLRVRPAPKNQTLEPGVLDYCGNSDAYYVESPSGASVIPITNVRSDDSTVASSSYIPTAEEQQQMRIDQSLSLSTIDSVLETPERAQVPTSVAAVIPISAENLWSLPVNNPYIESTDLEKEPMQNKYSMCCVMLVLSVIGLIVAASVVMFGNTDLSYAPPMQKGGPIESDYTGDELMDLIRQLVIAKSTTYSFSAVTNEALEWMSRDRYAHAMASSGTNNFQEILVQRFVLVTIMHGVVRDEWHHDGWLEPESECYWDSLGLTCDEETGLLTELKLCESGLGGTIPVELLWLTSLTSLDLSFNNFSGSMPTKLGLLTNLKWLDLSSNYLIGNLPSQLGYLTQLEFLRISFNSFIAGTIPEQLSDLTLLEELHIDTNALTGPIPPSLFSRLANLKDVELFANKLSGTIPTTINMLSKLTMLALGFNHLTGALPTELFAVTSLRNLILNDNGFQGPVPTEIGNLSSLARLDLAANALTGAIPHQALEQLPSLEILALETNAALSGTIPASLCVFKGPTIECDKIECECCWSPHAHETCD